MTTTTTTKTRIESILTELEDLESTTTEFSSELIDAQNIMTSIIFEIENPC